MSIFPSNAGERYVYKFVCDPEALFNMAYGSSALATTDINQQQHSGSGSPPTINCRSSSSLTMVATNGVPSPNASVVNTILNERHQLSQYYSNYQQMH